MSSARRAVITAATPHQLVMAQAVARAVGDRYADLTLTWYGTDPLQHLEQLRVPSARPVSFADLHGLRRCKLWRAGGSALRRRVRQRLAEALGPRTGGDTDLFIGNDGALFNQVAMEAVGAGWDQVVLYEEGVGLYFGSRKYLEKTVINALLMARGMPYRVPWRDFSRNRRIRRIACNHPALLSRADLHEVIDLGPAYAATLAWLAEQGTTGGVVEAVYISGNYSEAGHLGLEEELTLVGQVYRAIRRAGLESVGVKFHPLDSPAKRHRILAMGFQECRVSGPFELDCLRRKYHHIFSFRSSVLLNLALLLRPEQSRIWILRGRTGPARTLSQGPLAGLLARLTRSQPNFGFFDLDAPPPALAGVAAAGSPGR